MPAELILPRSPEAKIVEKYFEVVRLDPVISAVFQPIVLVESPTREAFESFGMYSMAVVAFSVKPQDHPSRRSTSFVGVMVSAYLPIEETSVDSKLLGLDLGNYFRKLAWRPLPDPVTEKPMAFATVEFTQLTPLITRNQGTRILSYRTIYETDVDPVSGEFV